MLNAGLGTISLGILSVFAITGQGGLIGGCNWGSLRPD